MSKVTEIELNGRVSVEQKKMLLALRAQGYRAEVCRGWEEARDTICEYLREGKTYDTNL